MDEPRPHWTKPEPSPLTESVREYCAEGEELLVTTRARRLDRDGRLPKNFALAVTMRRLLVLGYGGVLPRARELLLELPLADVESVEFQRTLVRTPRTIVRARGETYVWSVLHYDLSQPYRWARERGQA